MFHPIPCNCQSCNFERMKDATIACLKAGAWLIFWLILLFLATTDPARAEMSKQGVYNALQSTIDIEALANAIYKAEGVNSKHPYGILKHYKNTSPRQACINTIKSALKRFAKQAAEKDFIKFLGRTYCPVGAKNDPANLNQNWIRNVKYFYYKKN